MTRPILFAALLLATPALAQAPPRAPVANPAMQNPAMQAAQSAFDTLPEATRKQIQDDLIWASNFTATTSGQHGPRTHSAILHFQRLANLPQTGILDDGQRAMLGAAAARARSAARFAMQADPRTGASLPIAGALFTRRDTLPTGTRWESGDGSVVLETGVGRGGAEDLPAAFERFLTLDVPGRRVTYKLLRPDFFVVSGEIGPRSFYVRYHVGPNNLRGYALSYPTNRSAAMERHVISIANGFQAVPGAAMAVAAAPNAPQSPASAQQPAAQPDMLPSGVILTGLVVAPGKVVTAGLAGTCTDLRINGKPARITKPGSATTPAELDADTGSAKALSGPIEKSARNKPVVVVGFGAGRTPALVVVTGEMIETEGAAPRIAAPLPREGGGSLVLDRRGNVVAMLNAPRHTPRLVAGFVPALSHAALPASAVLPGAGTTAGLRPETTVGALTALVAPSLLPISCGHPLMIPKG